MPPPHEIGIRQIRTGEWRGLITSLASGAFLGASGVLQAQIDDIFAQGQTGMVTAQIVPLNSGATTATVAFTRPFYRIPSVVGNVFCPSGSGFIGCNPISQTSSGCVVGFGAAIPGAGYSLNLVAIDTAAVASGILSILSATTIGIDLITASSAAAQRVIMGVPAASDKGAPNGFCPLDSNAKIPTGYFPVGCNTGTIAAQLVALSSGATQASITFARPFSRTPSIIGNIFCPSGSGYIACNPISLNSGACIIGFGAAIPTTGYSLNIIAIDGATF